jgi:RHS repeat-associated protein
LTTALLLAVDGAAASDFRYLALRIEPDQLALVEYDTATTAELNTIGFEIAQNQWYAVTATFEGDSVTVTCRSTAPGQPIGVLTAQSGVLNALGDDTDYTGFTLGESANYHFRNLEYVTIPGAVTTHTEWAYDPYGRKVLQTEYDGTGVVVAKTRYVYDGWRLLQEINALNPGTVLAEYTSGPGYIDDVVRIQRGGQDYYVHADQQYSTVALTDAAGAVTERYTYDAFGNPSFYDGTGTPILSSTVNNNVLYTGRTWDPKINLYDYRTRLYDPTTGRFTTPDPLGNYGDWNNLGNPFTYVGNNPGAFADPYGLFKWGTFARATYGSFIDIATETCELPADLITGFLIGINNTLSDTYIYAEDVSFSGVIAGAALHTRLWNDEGAWMNTISGTADVASTIVGAKQIAEIIGAAYDYRLGNISYLEMDERLSEIAGLQTGMLAAGAALSTGRGRTVGKMSTSPNDGGMKWDPNLSRYRDTSGRFISDPARSRSEYKYTDAQRRSAWRRLEEDPRSGLTEAERTQIRTRGYRGPQRVNEYGEIETMELSHEPVNMRDGGTEVVPRWPRDHAAVDPHRYLKKR